MVLGGGLRDTLLIHGHVAASGILPRESTNSQARICSGVEGALTRKPRVPVGPSIRPYVSVPSLAADNRLQPDSFHFRTTRSQGTLNVGVDTRAIVVPTEQTRGMTSGRHFCSVQAGRWIAHGWQPTRAAIMPMQACFSHAVPCAK